MRAIDDPRFFALLGEDWASVSRVCVGTEELAAVVSEVRELARGARSVEWQVHGELAAPLRALGFGDPDPPKSCEFAALAIEHAPPRGPVEVEVRRVESFEDFRTALEIWFAASEWSEEGKARERERARQTYERRRTRPGGEWLAYVDGRPAAAAAAIAGERGLFLAGGATAPWARGRGCYRALVHARWEDAVTRGTPALVVHAQHDTSRPILERLGFELVAELHELEDRGR